MEVGEIAKLKPRGSGPLIPGWTNGGEGRGHIVAGEAQGALGRWSVRDLALWRDDASIDAACGADLAV
jgi:hypothetical protein